MAITFDNADNEGDVVLIADATSLQNIQTPNGITISAWIKATSAGAAGFNNASIIGKGYDEAGRWQFRFDESSAGRLAFFKDGSTDLKVASTTTVGFGAWHHVLMTWTGSTTATTVHIYIDGTEVSYTTQTNGVTLASDVGLGMAIGNRTYPSDYTFDGSITEVAIWNVVLTASEIGQLKIRTKGTPIGIQRANLKMYLPMDDKPNGSADGATVADLSGNGNNGTANDGANNTGCTWLIDPLYGKMQTKSWWGDR